MTDAFPEGFERGVRWLVSGRVQGVGYRAFTRQAAAALEVVGTVRNLDDGRVEARVVGSERAIDRLYDRLLEGPRGARVEGIEEVSLADAEARSLADRAAFEILR